MSPARTQVCIIGGGPAGMLLSHILDGAGIDSIVLERQSKAHVLGRIRAGVLEPGSVRLLRAHGLGDRMDREGRPKRSNMIVWEGKEAFHIDTARYTGELMMAWGQTQITEDLYAARTAAGADLRMEVSDVALHDVTGRPHVTFTRNGRPGRIDCDVIAGCDGFHGPSRQAIPLAARQEFERAYPFGWLGIMVERPPLETFVYAYHSDGMAMAAQRNPQLSRYYVQAPIGDTPADWPDDRFWDTLLRRFPPDMAARIQTGPSIEKSMAPLRSFVCEPMRWGNLFLAGDAAHIVPPTGAKGLNLAFSDVFYLSRALIAHYRDRSDHYLNSYSDMALRRVWAAENISWQLTRLLHVFPGEDPFDQKIRQSDYDRLLTSETAARALAHDYIGLPFED